VSGNGVHIHHNTLSEDIVESIKQLQKQIDSIMFILNKIQEQHENLIAVVTKFNDKIT
jgi:CO dehydrogenase nickel-insertion accessory protein CooC1